jgi:hypothetical protein
MTLSSETGRLEFPLVTQVRDSREPRRQERVKCTAVGGGMGVGKGAQSRLFVIR